MSLINAGTAIDAAVLVGLPIVAGSLIDARPPIDAGSLAF